MKQSHIISIPVLKLVVLLLCKPYTSLHRLVHGQCLVTIEVKFVNKILV